MRILHVNEHAAAVGGAERMLLDTCALQRARGDGVALLHADDVPADAHPFAAFRLPRSGGYRDARSVAPRLEQIVATFGPDIVHLHNTQGFLSPFLVRWLGARVPTVKYVHDARLICPRFRTKILARRGTPCTYAMGVRCAIHCLPIERGGGERLSLREAALRMVDLYAARALPATIAGSAYVREELLRNGFRHDRVHVIPGFTAKRAERAAPPADPRSILAIGRFDGIKGMEELVGILPRLATGGWTATLVGDGENLEPSRERARRLGVADRVRFPGHLPTERIDRCYAEAAVVVVPSPIPEAFGLVGIEAMAFGKPVVAFDIGGIRDWLDDGRTGYRVPPGDAEALRQRVDLLLGDPALALRLGAAGRARVEREYRPETHIARLADVYERVGDAHA